MRLQKLVKEQRAEKLVLEKRAADVAADKARLTEQCAQAMEAQQQLQASLRTVQERLATVAAAKAVADERLEEKTQECQRYAALFFCIGDWLRGSCAPAWWECGCG